MSDEAKIVGCATSATAAPEHPNGDVVPGESSRANSQETFRREITAEIQADESARKVELSFSSELPVQRGEYLEVLSHDPSDVDLSRLNDSHPLLLNHDPERQIGVIENATVGGDKKGRAVVRFSKSQLGDEIWNDVKDGIRRLVSVGYRRVKELSSEVRDGMESVRFAWQPYEISIVSVPADATVGVGRADENSVSKKDINTMSVEVTNEAPKRDQVKDNAEILAIRNHLETKGVGVRDLADQALKEGWTVDKFRSEAMDKLPEAKPVQTSPLADVKERDWKKYSITRAINMQLPGEKRDGLENELSQELSIKYGKRADGVFVPDEAFSRTVIAGTPTLGGFLVENSVASNEFIEILRNRSQVLNLGARVLNLTNPTFIPRQAGAGTVNWIGETVASTLSAINFTNLTLTPKGVGAYHQYSKQLLATGNPSIDALVRDDITQTLALAIDLAALHGAGTAEPVGIVGTTGINTVALSANGLALGNATAYPALVSLESLIAADNADVSTMGYLVRPAHRGALKTNTRFASTNTPVWEDGQINGYRAEVTNQIATNLTTGTATTLCSAIFFGNWNDLLIASFGSTDLVVDPYTAGANAVVRLYARRWVDIGVRRPESFALLGGLLTN